MIAASILRPLWEETCIKSPLSRDMQMEPYKGRYDGAQVETSDDILTL
jgi:hypothetical protein